MRSTILLATVALASAQSSLFFSEYVEGTYYNKAVEIYNPTGASISLDDVVVQWHHNGKVYSESSNYDVSLTGKTIGAQDTFVICRDHKKGAGQQVAAAKCDMQIAYGSAAAEAVLHNGDDAIELKVNGVVVDVIGTVGSDPGSCWKNAQGRCMTKDQTMRRASTVSKGVTAFDITQWSLEGKNTVSGLGEHTGPALASATAKFNGKVAHTKTAPEALKALSPTKYTTCKHVACVKHTNGNVHVFHTTDNASGAHGPSIQHSSCLNQASPSGSCQFGFPQGHKCTYDEASQKCSCTCWQVTPSPTPAPTKAPTMAPTKAPTMAPTKAPTKAPTRSPTRSPTKAPTNSPTPPPTPSCNPSFTEGCFFKKNGSVTICGGTKWFNEKSDSCENCPAWATCKNGIVKMQTVRTTSAGARSDSRTFHIPAQMGYDRCRISVKARQTDYGNAGRNYASWGEHLVIRHVDASINLHNKCGFKHQCYTDLYTCSIDSNKRMVSIDHGEPDWITIQGTNGHGVNYCPFNPTTDLSGTVDYANGHYGNEHVAESSQSAGSCGRTGRGNNCFFMWAQVSIDCCCKGSSCSC